MSRKIELVHAGQWTPSQVVRLVRTLVCPVCNVVDVDIAAAADGTSANADREVPSVRIDGRTIRLDPAPGAEPEDAVEPARCRPWPSTSGWETRC